MNNKIPLAKTHRKITSESYSACHKWLDRHFVKHTYCDFCESSRFVEWALIRGKKHSHKRIDYLCLCSSCHKKYDYTPERRKKLSASLKLVPHTKEWNKKVGLANIGYKHTPEAKQKMSLYRKKHPRKRNAKTGRFK